MQSAAYRTRLALGHRVPQRKRPTLRDRMPGEPARSTPGRQLSEWLSGVPHWVHAAPWVALAALGGVLLIPGVVPRGPECGVAIGTASLGERHAFIQISAVAFGVVAVLFLLSALAASAQRRAALPGLPTIVCAAALGVITLAAVISPYAPLATPVQVAMMLAVLGLFAGGSTLAISAGASAIAWLKLTGPRSLRAAQIAAWIGLLLVLPLVMAFTYVTVTPICWG